MNRLLILCVAALGVFGARLLRAQTPARPDDSYPFRAVDVFASPRMSRFRADFGGSLRLVRASNLTTTWRLNR